MDIISYEYTKQRRDFGAHPSFGDSKMESMSIRALAQHQEMWIDREMSTVELDCIPQMSEHWVNTERYEQLSRGQQFTDGAWPKEVKTNEAQDRERFLRRIENQPSYQSSVKRLVRTVERSIEQNNTIDIYEKYFDNHDFELDSEPPTARTLSVFRDPNKVKRAASKISWHPDGSNKLAVAHSITQFQKMPENMPTSSYIWDVSSPNEPELEILPQSPLCSIEYNPRSSDHLVGGSYNGLVAFWDLRKGSTNVASSLIEHSHHDPVYDISWIQSRTGNECVSASTDGKVLWWDVRKLDSGPIDAMTLRNQDIVYGASSLEYRSDAGATRYLIGSEQGEILLLDRKAKKDAESQKQIKTIYGLDSGRHLGPIYSTQRHPYNVKYFLTVGDWSARVWMEDLKNPIIATPYDGAYLTAGCWSPTRPGVFMTTKVDGTLDVWDYFLKQNAPVFSTKVGETPISSIRVKGSGDLVALGSDDGTVTVLEIGASLYETQGSEKQTIQQMLERETKRERQLEIRANQRNRENRKKTGTSEQGFGGGGSSTPLGDDRKSSADSTRGMSARPVSARAQMMKQEAKAAKAKQRIDQSIQDAEDAFWAVVQRPVEPENVEYPDDFEKTASASGSYESKAEEDQQGNSENP